MNANAKINRFIKTLMEKKLTVAFAESITCGLATHRLSTVKGTSEVLRGSIVCYNEKVKKELMGVSDAMVKKYTCESMEVTEKLTSSLSKFITADIYAALTGLASAGGSETKSKPVGTVFFCLRYKNKIFKERKVFRGTPLQIREKACLALYDLILSKVEK